MADPNPLYVKPAKPDLVVRRPDTMERLPAEGAKVPRTTYWRRRLLKGDVVETKAPAKPAAKQAGKTPAEKEG